MHTIQGFFPRLALGSKPYPGGGCGSRLRWSRHAILQHPKGKRCVTAQHHAHTVGPCTGCWSPTELEASLLPSSDDSKVAGARDVVLELGAPQAIGGAHATPVDLVLGQISLARAEALRLTPGCAPHGAHASCTALLDEPVPKVIGALASETRVVYPAIECAVR